MIVSFKHKGLERFFLKGDSSKLNQSHVPRIRKIVAQQIKDMPGWELHPLRGNLRDHWPVKVNYRAIFVFEGQRVEVLDIDYLDYH